MSPMHLQPISASHLIPRICSRMGYQMKSMPILNTKADTTQAVTVV